ncbi:MAG: hypothetical protein ACKO6H_09315 [Betaproteobacteria bacterium]
MSLCYRQLMCNQQHMTVLSMAAQSPQAEVGLLEHDRSAPLSVSRAFVLLSGAGGLLRLRRAR